MPFIRIRGPPQVEKRILTASRLVWPLVRRRHGKRTNTYTVLAAIVPPIQLYIGMPIIGISLFLFK